MGKKQINNHRDIINTGRKRHCHVCARVLAGFAAACVGVNTYTDDLAGLCGSSCVAIDVRCPVDGLIRNGGG
jgi:hypothetical protein